VDVDRGVVVPAIPTGGASGDVSPAVRVTTRAEPTTGIAPDPDAAVA
jgi:hypothetical protein